MSILSILSINIFSLFILITILVYEHNGNLKKFFQDKIFVNILKLTMIMDILDSLEWMLNGKIGHIWRWVYYIILECNFTLNPVIAFMWVLYVSYQLYHNEKKIKNIVKRNIVPIGINALLVVLSPIYHFIFYLDNKNIYHRGSLYIYMIMLSYLFLIYTLFMIFQNKKRITAEQFRSLIVFPFPVAFAGIVQSACYGISVIWPGFTLSIIIIYISIQNIRLNTDYLTGLYNRRQLDIYLSENIGNSSKNNLLAAVMIDIDDFKIINDKFGHNVGDQALVSVAEILQSCFTRNDLICRYAGDEFVVAFDIKNKAELEKKIFLLEQALVHYNSKSNRPYKIGLSMGYDIYDYNSKMNSEQFIKHIDENMYENKKIKKNLLK